MKKIRNDLGVWIEGIIRYFVNDSCHNNLKNDYQEKVWDNPLIGFSSGADPIYKFFKKDIGSFYFTPIEWFHKSYTGVNVKEKELTVISWILPQTQITKGEHRLPRRMPTERWARARIYGEEFNDKLREYVVKTLDEAGYLAVAPMLSTQWSRETSNKYGFASNWSERHAAYVSGLGTFGLCDGLITAKGKAMRTGSVITRIEIRPTLRDYKGHNTYCLYYSNGTCLECVHKCPVGAISKSGHDKYVCSKYVRSTRDYVKRSFYFEGYGCGLCQTGVACESRIPRTYLE